MQGGLEVVEAEHLAELHLAERGFAVLVRMHRDAGHVGTIQADEVVQVDLELRLYLSAPHADGLVAQDLSAAFDGVGSGGRGLFDAHGTPRLLGGLWLEH